MLETYFLIINLESLHQKSISGKQLINFVKIIDAAEYKHVVLGLIFLQYISDSFEDLYAKLRSNKGDYAGANPEDLDVYKAVNIFFVPTEARWSLIQC
jgi:type I restriction enzyme M protein